MRFSVWHINVQGANATEYSNNTVHLLSLTAQLSSAQHSNCSESIHFFLN